MERIKWFGGVALAYFSLIIIALLVNNPEHAWVYWVATALVIVVLMKWDHGLGVIRNCDSNIDYSVCHISSEVSDKYGTCSVIQYWGW